MKSPQPIPPGKHTITPHIVVRGAKQAIDFYRRAFGAEEVGRLPGPDGELLMHAELKIGDSHLMLCDEMPWADATCRAPESLGGTSVTLHVYCEDADAVYERAIKAGAKVSMPIMDAFWGDRYGRVTDPFGHEWSIATRQKDLTFEEMEKAAGEMFAHMPKGV